MMYVTAVQSSEAVILLLDPWSLRGVCCVHLVNNFTETRKDDVYRADCIFGLRRYSRATSKLSKHD